MMAGRKTSSNKAELIPAVDYDGLVERISQLLERSQRGAVRAVDRIRTATYWQIGRYIVECEQSGQERAGYGEVLIERLAKDLRREIRARVVASKPLGDAGLLPRLGDLPDSVWRFRGAGGPSRLAEPTEFDDSPDSVWRISKTLYSIDFRDSADTVCRIPIG